MWSTSRAHSRSAGFSLVEVLVALAVAAMLTAMLTRFYAGTRANAARVGEVLEMTTLSETLLTRLSSSENLAPGRADGRIGIFSWRMDITPIEFTAIARQISEKKKPTSPEEAKDKGKMLSTMSFSDDAKGAAQQKKNQSIEPPKEWRTYRVSLLIEAPSGRRHVSDTIRVGQVPSENR